jgi:hypothetical protein
MFEVTIYAILVGNFMIISTQKSAFLPPLVYPLQQGKTNLNPVTSSTRHFALTGDNIAETDQIRI